MDHTGPKMAKTHCHPVWLPCENVVWDSHCKITAQKLMKESKRANSLRPKYSQIISLLRPFTQLSIPYQSVRFLLKTGVSSRGGSLPKGGCAGIDQRHQLAVGDFHGLPTPSRKAAISCQALNSDSTQLRPPQVLARRNFLGFTPGSTQCSCHLQFRHRLHCLKSQILYACIPGCWVLPGIRALDVGIPNPPGLSLCQHGWNACSKWCAIVLCHSSAQGLAKAVGLSKWKTSSGGGVPAGLITKNPRFLLINHKDRAARLRVYRHLTMIKDQNNCSNCKQLQVPASSII